MRKAFTLAEVLITLGIIGVVAAMTLPPVINNINNKEKDTALKKAYSVAQQALQMMAASEGDVNPSNYTVRTFVKSYIKYFNNAVDCGTVLLASPGSLCVSSKDIANYKNFNNTTSVNAAYFDDGQFALTDGMQFFIQNEQGEVSDDADVNRSSNIIIIIDINGKNKIPNRLGYDVFAFQLMNSGKLLPMGQEGTGFVGEDLCSAASTSNRNGMSCTYKALTDSNYWNNLPK